MPINEKSSHQNAFSLCRILTKIFIIIQVLPKMTNANIVQDPKPELVNSHNQDIAQQQPFFRQIGNYTENTEYMHVRIPFNFTPGPNVIKPFLSVIYEFL
jgi:ABC-type dipeptide/oligopeptide/nickel transport system permease component